MGSLLLTCSFIGKIVGQALSQMFSNELKKYRRRTKKWTKTTDFESDVVQPNTSFWAELKGRNVSKAGDCLRSHRVAADADNDVAVSISRLMAQSHGLQRALTPRPIPCLFCDH